MIIEMKCDKCGKRRITAGHWRYVSKNGDVDSVDQAQLCMECSRKGGWTLNEGTQRHGRFFVEREKELANISKTHE